MHHLADEDQQRLVNYINISLFHFDQLCAGSALTLTHAMTNRLFTFVTFVTFAAWLFVLFTHRIYHLRHLCFVILDM